MFNIDFLLTRGLLLLFPFYTSVAGLYVKVINEVSSRVDGYYPLTIILMPEKDIPEGGAIIFFNLERYSPTTECTELIQEVTPTFSYSCRFSFKHLLLFNLTTQIEAGIEITVEFKSLLYNDEQVSRRINIKTTDSAFGIIESQDNKEWIPLNPAKFTSLFLSPTSTSMCRLFNLTIDGILSIETKYDSVIEFTFDSAFDLSSVVSDHLNNISIDKEVVRGVTTKDFNELNITLKNIKAPSIPKKYTILITTYSVKGYKVQEDSAALTITLDTSVQSGNIKLVGKKAVCENGQYELQTTSFCQSVINAKYKIAAPVNIFMSQPTIVYPGRDLVEFSTIQFQLLNPCSIIPGNILHNNNFTISIYNGNTNEEAFTFNAKLPSNTSYEHGLLKNFVVEPEYRGYGYECAYTFSMINSNLIPLNGRIHLTLNPLIKFVESKIVTVNGIDTKLIRFDELISVLIPLEIPAFTEIKIIIGNLKNPYDLNTYSGFNAYSLDANGYAIDKSTIKSIYINEPGIATVTYTLSNPRNSELSIYSFTLISSDLSINKDDVIGIKMPKEIDSSTCDVVASVTGSQFNAKKFNFLLSVNDMTLNSSRNSVIITLTCKNPPTTALTNSIKFAVFRSNGFKILKGGVKIQTTKGSYLAQGSSIHCDKTCPHCNSLCTLTLLRNTNTAFRSIVIINNRLDLTKLTCKYDEDGQSFLSNCTNANDGTEAKIKLTISTKREVSVIVITNINLIYPEYSETMNHPLKVLIYSSDTINPNGLIEEDQATVVSGICLYPCKTCSKGYNICDSCTDIPIHNEVYYLYPDNLEECGLMSRTNCRELDNDLCCGTYHKDKVNHLCLQCNSSCKGCEGTKDNCTECLDSSLFLSKGECKDTCDEGTYLDSSGRKCESCNNGCKHCISNKECLECYNGYIFDEDKQCILKCPREMYADINTCKSCDSNCATCITSSTKCTGCNLLKAEKYLQFTTSKCVSREVCENGKYIASDTTNTCDPCGPDCEECKGARTFCTKCSSEKVFYVERGVCAFACPSYSYYKIGTETDIGYCTPCENHCELCMSNTECITCVPNKFLITDTKECKDSCPQNYYESYRKCYPCNPLCTSCNARNTCTNCISGYYLSNGECYKGGCPSGTFNSKDKLCENCDPSCSTCAETKYSCIECSPKYQKVQNKCIEPCSTEATLIGDKCEQCDSTCLTCSGAIDHCTSCKNSDYLYKNKCWNQCPSSSAASLTSPNLCIPCLTGCKECDWKSNESSIPELCITCLPAYKYFNGKCYLTCFDGYTVSSDSLYCIPNKANKEPSGVYDYWPFPHLTLAGLLAMVIILGQGNESNVLIVSNLIVLLNVIVMSCYVFTVATASINWNIEIVIVIGALAILQLILNVSFLIVHEKYTSLDNVFSSSIANHSCFNYFLLSFSAIFSYQTFRLLYSHLLDLELFFMRFTDFNNLFKPLNRFSIFQLFLVQGPITIYSIICLIRFPYGTSYYISIIETLVLSSLLCLLLTYTIKNTEAIIIVLERRSQPVALSNSSIYSQTTINGAIIEERKFKEDAIGFLHGSNMTRYTSDIPLRESNPKVAVIESMVFMNRDDLTPTPYPHPDNPSTRMIKYKRQATGNKGEHQSGYSRKKKSQDTMPWIIDNNPKMILTSTINRHKSSKEVKRANIELDDISISVPQREEAKSRSKVKGSKKTRAKTAERKRKVPLERIPEAPEKDEESQYNSKLSCQNLFKDQREIMYMRSNKTHSGSNPPSVI